MRILIAITITLTLVSNSVLGQEPGDVVLVGEDYFTNYETTTVLEECGGCDVQCQHCLGSRDRLFGDLLGPKSHLAQHGIIADLRLSQYYQGVASGGSDQIGMYGGKLDYNFTFLGEPLGLNKGFTTLLHAETRYGQSLVTEAGAFAFPNTNMLYPKPEGVTSITGLLFMQALNEKVALAAGKINVVDFWGMVYPDSGRGLDGFMNLNSLTVGLPWLRFVNLSVNGAGILVLEGEQIEGGFLVFDTNNSTTTAGIDNLFDQGAGVLGLWRFFHTWDGKPGSHLVAGGWSSRTYTSLDANSWSFIPGQGQGLTPGTETGAWALAYYFNQVLWADPCNADRNVKFLTGWSLSDSNPSFGQWGMLATLESFGPFAHRSKDRMGVSYFYTGVSDDFKQLVSSVVAIEDVQGCELYYNAEVTPWFHLTGDLQVIDNEQSANDTAIAIGLRAVIDL
ncbi:MAG: hypothetical protein COA78_21805 [Blastopirellula sp.]|nr:MAG: hypothetical protein COA78_21805 [Blastopirellula sp.]